MLRCEVQAQAGTFYSVVLDGTDGWMEGLEQTESRQANGTWELVQVQAENDVVALFYTGANAMRAYVQALSYSGTISVRNPEITFVVRHA